MGKLEEVAVICSGKFPAKFNIYQNTESLGKGKMARSSWQDTVTLIELYRQIPMLHA